MHDVNLWPKLFDNTEEEIRLKRLFNMWFAIIVSLIFDVIITIKLIDIVIDTVWTIPATLFVVGIGAYKLYISEQIFPFTQCFGWWG